MLGMIVVALSALHGVDGALALKAQHPPAGEVPSMSVRWTKALGTSPAAPAAVRISKPGKSVPVVLSSMGTGLRAVRTPSGAIVLPRHTRVPDGPRVASIGDAQREIANQCGQPMVGLWPLVGEFNQYGERIIARSSQIYRFGGRNNLGFTYANYPRPLPPPVVVP